MLLSLLMTAAALLPEGVAVERSTGRVALWREGEVRIYAGDGLHLVATLPAPPAPLELLDFTGGVVVYAFTLPADNSPARAAVGVDDGRERLIWPNPGIGDRFPGLGARLTADGQGIFQFLALDGQLRGELGLGDDIPEGAGTVVTYRFADEQVWAIAAADFAGAVALAPADALVVTSDGELLRYRAQEGLVWRKKGEGRRRVILDVDLTFGAAVLASDGGLEVMGLDSGERRGSWRRGGVVGAKLLWDGRLLASTQDGQVWVVTPASGAGTAVPLAQLTEGEGPGGVSPCPSLGGPLSCLYAAPGGVILLDATGWKLLQLPPAPR